MPEAPWMILVVDDDPEICAQLKEFFEGEDLTADGHPVSVTTLADFDQALTGLADRHFDLLILDLRRGSQEDPDGDDAGLIVLEAIKSRQFIPVVFYTALPNHVSEGLRTQLVRVVSKADGLDALRQAAREIFATRLPTVNRGLLSHVAAVQRDYMWNFVAKNWDAFGSTPDHTLVAYYLARRLAITLSDAAVGKFVIDLGGEQAPAELKSGQVHPLRFYILPPLADVPPLVGELFNGTIGGEQGYWILLTPSCDIAQNKVEHVVFAGATPLKDSTAYKAVAAAKEQSKGKLNEAKHQVHLLVSNNKSDRFHYLPECLEIPDLVVDFQHIVGSPYATLQTLNRIAALDSPFAEALVFRFLRYFGRLGTPDLDFDAILNRLYPDG